MTCRGECMRRSIRIGNEEYVKIGDQWVKVSIDVGGVKVILSEALANHYKLFSFYDGMTLSEFLEYLPEYAREPFIADMFGMVYCEDCPYLRSGEIDDCDDCPILKEYGSKLKALEVALDEG